MTTPSTATADQRANGRAMFCPQCSYPMGERAVGDEQEYDKMCSNCVDLPAPYTRDQARRAIEDGVLTYDGYEEADEAYDD